MAPPRKRNIGEGKRGKNDENGNHHPSIRRKKQTTGIPYYVQKGVFFLVCVVISTLVLYYVKKGTTFKLNEPFREQKIKNEQKQEQSHVENEEQNIPLHKNSQASGSKTVPKQNTPSKPKEDLTMNPYDKTIAKELNKAKALLDKGKIEDSLGRFRVLVEQHPKSPLALYGKARSLDKLSDHRQSNDLLQECIHVYRKVADLPDSPLELKRLALSRMAERLAFFGRMKQSAAVLEKLAALFPMDEKILSNLGVQYLMYGDNKEAARVFKKVLSVNPNSGFAKSHLGFSLKVELHFEEAIPLLKAGVMSGEQEADHGRFYYHLGDALTKTGKPDEAYSWYVEAAKKGIFLSPLQRSLYNADTPLKAQPWWTPEETGYAMAIRKLEKNWESIRAEGLAIMDRQTGGFIPEEENLRDTGDWQQFTLYQQGRKLTANCRKTPQTCALMDTIPEATGCKRGQIKFSVMVPGTHVWPHTGPTNCRLRSHLGLVIPKDVAIRVGTVTKTWEEGKVIVIDDSIDHEVWHNGTSFRLIFIVDFWHPELTDRQRTMLSPI